MGWRERERPKLVWDVIHWNRAGPWIECWRYLEPMLRGGISTDWDAAALKNGAKGRVSWQAFTFFNELDVLRLRLETLHEVVDHFVLVEASKTHSNK